MTINTGIKNYQEVANKLSVFFASTYALLIKTQNFHWNVTGEHFYASHKLLEDLYEELASCIDTLAERIRALDVRTPASLSEFQKLSQIIEPKSQISWTEMISELLADNQAMARLGRELIELADMENDPATNDLITQRIEAHEKAAWMLRATLH